MKPAFVRHGLTGTESIREKEDMLGLDYFLRWYSMRDALGGIEAAA
jgi:hypothetical protein